MTMQGPARYASNPPPCYHVAAQIQENGVVELGQNGFQDPALAGVYDLIDKAESALSSKIAEADQLRADLEKAHHELHLLKVTQDAQGKLVANGNLEHHRSPPSSRSLSPSRRTEERPRREEMMLTTPLTQQEESRHRELRNSVIDAAIRETRLVAEKCSLERKLAELDMLYHREQQNVADATAKALSMREELVDKNMKLAYENQALGQERNIFVSSLLPLLEDFEFHPSTDAQAIVACVKALVQYLKESNERKSKESGLYRPWHLYAPPSPLNMQSPPRYTSAPSPIANGRGLEIVPQGVYQAQRPASPSSPMNVNTVLHQTEMASPLAKHMNTDLVVTHENGFHPEIDEADARSYTQTLEYAKRSPHLPTLPEEPNHAVSEEDDPLPAVAGLRIVGDAVLGSTLTVCGHSINGTALCNFQWIRYYTNGNTDDIEGASQTEYTLNADDCDTFIAIQCCPMDGRNRKGEQVTEFANNQNLIKCDQALEDQINGHIMASQAQFDVTIMGDETEVPGTLILKRSSYEIKRNGVRIVKEKYSPDVNVRVLLGHNILCAISSSDEREHILSFKENRYRDRAVLTLRRFRQIVLDGKKTKSKTWFGKIV